ncbi:hypothetical protein [Vibrio parahaemolyticus]|uniref:Uncharacterized protein n=1 Tax=Vibrio parahaemolyticus TaxID=670 RepID=A0AAW3IL83_VIBPH|nr:hypothetical protein [Vibrio parahaemolyticus]EGQ7663330.1 hypothetical protein [Vibrio parahaemolyticus]EGQ7829481.1 hypothetical protein [Vibrio parahaemolyticus]EGQ9828525.1 hypothetical protein [Vibrio parahaemolyticus]EGR0035625.1 hypothetical protein [Vibrio parahaemolyticus]EGR0203594.1 hypothetical protein [Vibrio parahaemolyticus]
MNKTQEVNQQTVLETKTLLLEVIQSPGVFKNDESIKVALKSQGGLAKYKNVERNINPCSLNTLKSLSESLLDKGFLELDSLRINAKNAINKSATGKMTQDSKTTLKQQIAALKNDLEVTKQSNFLLTTIIKEMRSQLKNMAEQDLTDEERIKRYKYANKKIEAQLNYVLNSEL